MGGGGVGKGRDGEVGGVERGKGMGKLREVGVGGEKGGGENERRGRKG